MNLSQILDAVLLGIAEGATEFLPVSSTGHLILLGDMLGFTGPESKVFSVVIQLGAILAVCWLYRAKLWGIALALLNVSPRAARSADAGSNLIPHQVRDDKEGTRLALLLLAAFLPAAVIGLFAHGFIKDVLFSPLIVAVTLVIGGFLILLIEKKKPEPRYHAMEALSLKTAFYIGLFQSVAMIPGTSRSGATIMGALLLGVDRKTAAEFSFLLAIPTMLAATMLDLYKAWGDLNNDGLLVIAVGFVTAFFSALIVVKWLIRFVQHHSFAAFAYYRIILGGAMLVWLL